MNKAESPRVSVVIPSYNSAWSIERTIDSILTQTFTNFEAIIINDGSTDDLHDRVARYLQDPRLRVVDQENRGLAGARNRGIAEARAELVAPIDADDLWHPDFLSAAVSRLDADTSAPFAYAYSFRIDEHDRVLLIPRLKRAPRHDFHGLLSLNSVGCGSSAVIRRSLVQRIGGYDETMRTRDAGGAEDWKLVLQLASLGQPALIEKYLVGYRLVGTSMSQSNPRRQLRAVLAVIDDVRNDFPDVSLRWFKDGRTMMSAWLLPTFLKHGLIADATREVFHAYVRNPLWFRNPNVRLIHQLRLQLLIRFLLDTALRRVADNPPLYSLVMEGKRPFAYMNPRSNVDDR